MATPHQVSRITVGAYSADERDRVDAAISLRILQKEKRNEELREEIRREEKKPWFNTPHLRNRTPTQPPYPKSLYKPIIPSPVLKPRSIEEIQQEYLDGFPNLIQIGKDFIECYMDMKYTITNEYTTGRRYCTFCCDEQFKGNANYHVVAGFEWGTPDGNINKMFFIDTLSCISCSENMKNLATEQLWPKFLHAFSWPGIRVSKTCCQQGLEIKFNLKKVIIR